MKNIEHFEAEHLPISYKQIKDDLREVYQAVDNLWDENIEYKQRVKKEQEITIEYIKKLESQKDRFKFIFETSHGSKYFVLEDGHSLRIKNEKNSDNENIYKIQPVMSKIFFVDKENFEKIKNIRDLDYLIGEPIPKITIKEGVYPIELNSTTMPAEIVYSEDDNNITLSGSRYKDTPDEQMKDQLFGGFHLGHEISKIIK